MHILTGTLKFLTKDYSDNYTCMYRKSSALFIAPYKQFLYSWRQLDSRLFIEPHN